MTLGKFVHNFNGHLHTINSHRRLVRKYCFKVGLYRQSTRHRSAFRGLSIIRMDTEALIMPSGRIKEFLRRGFTIRDAISIIMSTGLITMWMAARGSLQA